MPPASNDNANDENQTNEKEAISPVDNGVAAPNRPVQQKSEKRNKRLKRFAKAARTRRPKGLKAIRGMRDDEPNMTGGVKNLRRAIDPKNLKDKAAKQSAVINEQAKGTNQQDKDGLKPKKGPIEALAKNARIAKLKANMKDAMAKRMAENSAELAAAKESWTAIKASMSTANIKVMS